MGECLFVTFSAKPIDMLSFWLHIILSLKERKVKHNATRVQPTGIITGTFPSVKLFKHFRKETLLPAHSYLFQTTSNIRYPLGFGNRQLLIPPLRHRKRQKANYLHNLKPSVMHVYFTLGASLGGSWYANRHHAFRPVEQNTDYL